MSHVQSVLINDDWRITPYSYLNECAVTGVYPTQDGFRVWVKCYLASHYSVDIEKCSVDLCF